ncbi:M6 family metalloprotease domain-containing protein [Aminomonas paucivorans]|uniref:M6 family metalloprotease domain-containing protein n=1 Tax=Aminomonas paucivorans TaxID=81412 RepID=UPI00331F43F1
MRKWGTGALVVLALTLCAAGAWGAPANPFPVSVTQPDGTKITVFQRGDEFRHWTETPDGYSLARNPVTKFWEYAVRSGKSLRPSGVVYRPGTAAPASVSKHMAPQGQSRALRAEGSRGAIWTPRPVSGTRTILLLRVGFLDRGLGTDASVQEGAVFGATGSVKKYYGDQSRGNLSIASARGGTAALTLNLTATDFNNGNHPGALISDATVPDRDTLHANEVAFVTSVVNHAAAAGVDFPSYDTNGDGQITPDELSVYLIVAGFEESAGGGLTPSVWAHQWESDLGAGAAHQVTVGGKVLAKWAMNGEYYDATNPMPCGVIVHELGHQFCALPDLYDTSNTNEGLGYFSVMASGSWGAPSGQIPGTCPVNLDTWSRQYLGWEIPTQPTGGTVTLGTPHNGTHSSVKLLGTGHRTTEYFLAEVRDRTGWDEGLSRFENFSGLTGGILLLHVDEEVGSGSLGAGNDFNTYVAGGHQGCMAVEADGPHLAKTDNTATRGSRTTLWYSGNESYVGDGTFSGSGNPNSAFYDGSASGIAMTAISAPGSTMTCTVSAPGGATPTGATPRTSSGGGCSGLGFLPLGVLILAPLMALRRRRRA